MSTTQTIPPPASTRRFDNAAEWHHALGDIPLERIVMDPWPGTATEQDLLTFVEHDQRLVELIDGTLVEKPAGSYESKVAFRLIHFLLAWVLPRHLWEVTGEAGPLWVKRGRVRVPDVAFTTTERELKLPKPHPAIPSIAPDLAVEVLSESNTETEIAQKKKEYFESGTRLVWIVDPPSRTVAVYTSPGEKPDQVIHENDQLDGGDVLPGFTLKVADIFPAAT